MRIPHRNLIRPWIWIEGYYYPSIRIALTLEPTTPEIRSRSTPYLRTFPYIASSILHLFCASVTFLLLILPSFAPFISSLYTPRSALVLPLVDLFL